MAVDSNKLPSPSSFPCKLHRMLQDSESFFFSHIVSWQRGGVTFKVNDPDIFESQIMKAYFKQTKYKSFQKQLNVYGFKRVQTGPNKGGYIHKFFMKGRPELCEKMERNRPYQKATLSLSNVSVKSTDEPMNVSMNELFTQAINSADISFQDTEVDTFYDFFFPQDPVESGFLSRALLDDSLCESNNVQCIQRTFNSNIDINVSDFEPILPFLEETDSEVFSNNRLHLTCDEQASFPWKLHLMLQNSKKEKYQHIVSWVGDGTSFKVHNCKSFVEKVLPNYFDQTKYESFRRQLNWYGFTRISRGADRGLISHPYFREDAKWLCEKITKK